MLIKKYFILLITLSLSFSAFSAAIKYRVGPVRVVVVKGSPLQMGVQYGEALQYELRESLALLKEFYIEKLGFRYDQLVTQADIFYQRFPNNDQRFMQGVAQGSGLTLDDEKILNAMETLFELYEKSDRPGCAFLSLPASKTSIHSHLIGRNYDYSQPFDQIAQYLTVTILKNNQSIPTALIALPGEIYCPTCINAYGLMMAVNSGSPSGGYFINHDRETLLAQMKTAAQQSKNLAQLDKQLNAAQTDYSLIVNAADQSVTHSFEYSSTLGMKYVFYLPDDISVSTNYFLNPSWRDLPNPTDENTWMGLTRRNNLLQLAFQPHVFDVHDFQRVMNKTIQQGGARWEHTIYQLIFDTKNKTLYVKVNSKGKKWHRIPLRELLR